MYLHSYSCTLSCLTLDRQARSQLRRSLVHPLQSQPALLTGDSWIKAHTIVGDL